LHILHVDSLPQFLEFSLNLSLTEAAACHTDSGQWCSTALRLLQLLLLLCWTYRLLETCYGTANVGGNARINQRMQDWLLPGSYRLNRE